MGTKEGAAKARQRGIEKAGGVEEWKKLQAEYASRAKTTYHGFQDPKTLAKAQANRKKKAKK